jgi:hypothetical protein
MWSFLVRLLSKDSLSFVVSSKTSTQGGWCQWRIVSTLLCSDQNNRTTNSCKGRRILNIPTVCDVTQYVFRNVGYHSNSDAASQRHKTESSLQRRQKFKRHSKCADWQNAIRSFDRTQYVRLTVRNTFVWQNAIRSFDRTQYVRLTERDTFVWQNAIRSFDRTRYVRSTERNTFVRQNAMRSFDRTQYVRLTERNTFVRQNAMRSFEITQIIAVHRNGRLLVCGMRQRVINGEWVKIRKEAAPVCGNTAQCNTALQAEPVEVRIDTS